jgi:hypothetical protein
MMQLRRDLASPLVTVSLLVVSAAPVVAKPAATRVAGANRIDVYQVRWWGAKGSELDRPIYRVARIDNGRLELRHIIVKGRPLDDYVLPYWPIRSCLAIVNRPAELAHQVHVKMTRKGKSRRESLVVHEGFELASVEQADVLNITNRGDGAAVLMEQFLVVAKDSPAIAVVARVTNESDESMEEVQQQVSYEQGFNWGDLFACKEREYTAVQAGDDLRVRIPRRR